MREGNAQVREDAGILTTEGTGDTEGADPKQERNNVALTRFPSSRGGPKGNVAIAPPCHCEEVQRADVAITPQLSS